MVDKPLITIIGLGETESQIALLLAEKNYQVLCIQPNSIPHTVILNSFIDVIHLDKKKMGKINILRPDPELLDTNNNDYSLTVDSILNERSIPVLYGNEPWKEYLYKKENIVTIVCNEKYIQDVKDLPGIRIAIGLEKFYLEKSEFDLLIGDRFDMNHSIAFLAKDLDKNDCKSVPIEEQVLYAKSTGIWNLHRKAGDVLHSGDIIGKIDHKDLKSEYNEHILHKVIASGTPVGENDEVARLIPGLENYSVKNLAAHKAIVYEIEKII